MEDNTMKKKTSVTTSNWVAIVDLTTPVDFKESFFKAHQDGTSVFNIKCSFNVYKKEKYTTEQKVLYDNISGFIEFIRKFDEKTQDCDNVGYVSFVKIAVAESNLYADALKCSTDQNLISLNNHGQIFFHLITLYGHSHVYAHILIELDYQT